MLESISNLFPNAKIISTHKPAAGSSAEMLIVTLQLTNGEMQTVTLRRHKQVEQEHKLLQWLHAAGVLATKPLFWDEDNRVLILEFINGENRYDAGPPPNIGRAIGKQLALIHATAIPQAEHPLIQAYPADLGKNTSAHTEAEIRAALEPLWPIPTNEPPVLIHGDFWPGNMLWQGDELVGVIDWEDAKLGNRYQDLAISRFDCCFIYGRETMNALTAEYTNHWPVDPKTLAKWELFSALRAAKGIPDWVEGWAEMGRPDLTEEVIWQSHRWFLDQALDKLSR